MGDKTSESHRVFINYRRADTQEVALHLYRELGRCLEQAEVFFDQRELEPATPYPEALRQEVSRATVVLVLIGPRWLTLHTPDGIRLLDDPGDWVRTEIELALAAGKIVLPVKVDQAPELTPRTFRTIPALERLAELQAMPLTTQSWEPQFDAIVQFLVGHGFRRVRTEGDGRVAGSPSPLFRSTVPARGRRPFIGRESLLDAMWCSPASTQPDIQAGHSSSTHHRVAYRWISCGLGSMSLACHTPRGSASRTNVCRHCSRCEAR